MDRMSVYEALVASGFMMWFLKYLITKVIEYVMEQKRDLERRKETWVTEKIDRLEKLTATLQSSIDLHAQKLVAVEAEIKATRTELVYSKEKRDSWTKSLEEFVKSTQKRFESLEKTKIVKQGDIYILKRGEG